MSSQMKVDEFCKKLKDWAPLFQAYMKDTAPEVQDFTDWCDEFRDWMANGAQEASTEAKVQKAFDFGDGNGPVPAHQHKNPDGTAGGWVADTATVAATAFLGPTARVYGNARVSDNAKVSGDARVYGNAWVCGNARVSGNAKVSGDAQVFGGAQVFGTARVYDNRNINNNETLTE